MIDKSHISCHSELDSESIRLRFRVKPGMTILLKSFFRSFGYKKRDVGVRVLLSAHGKY